MTVYEGEPVSEKHKPKTLLTYLGLVMKFFDPSHPLKGCPYFVKLAMKPIVTAKGHLLVHITDTKEFSLNADMFLNYMIHMPIVNTSQKCHPYSV